MATFLFDYIDQLGAKWYEVDVLIEKAKKIRESEPVLYNAICRSISVLIVAHFEGYIKDVVKNVVKDLNHSVDFKDLPDQVKRTYCTKYLGQNLDSIDKNYEAKVKKLINKFNEIDCQISHEPFFYPANKNPNPNVVQKIFARFGLSNVFHFIHESTFDDIFSEPLSQIKDRILNLRLELLQALESFPYAFDITKHHLEKSPYDGKTLWQEFLEQINQKRHEVAHGNEFDNVEDVYSLETKKNKVVLLELILAGIVSSKMTPILKEEAS